jgi:hypothetical protein
MRYEVEYLGGWKTELSKGDVAKRRRVKLA